MWRAPINGSLIWKRSIVGVEMTFGCHCCPLIKAPLTEGGRACCNILQLRLHSTLSTPRAPGVVLLKDTICTLFPVSSFWRSLLKLDKISLLSHASIQVFQHAFLVNQRRTCDLRGWAFFFMSISTLPSPHSCYISHSLLVWVYIFQRWCSPISWHSPVRETACQFSVLQKPHESLMTHIKQLDCHRGCVGCSINLLVAAWMDRLHCSKNPTYIVRSVKLSCLQGGDFMWKTPK